MSVSGVKFQPSAPGRRLRTGRRRELLGAFAAAWHQARADDATCPALRLANLVALRHPLSVDTYLERTLSRARGILVRLIGGGTFVLGMLLMAYNAWRTVRAADRRPIGSAVMRVA